MRIVICPDKFAGTLSAVEAANAIADGWRAVAPADELLIRPVADGGPGFVEVLHASLGGEPVEVPTIDPLGRPVAGRVLIVGDTAYVESAHACGLHHLAEHERDPKVTTTTGLGALVNAAAARAGRVVIGLGGSGTNDGGRGFIEALKPLSAKLIGASDVDNPLTGPEGASAVFGPQKGATPQDVELLDARLRDWAAHLEATMPTCPRGLAQLPGGGAAGGLGAAILALGGRIISGIDLVRDQTGLDSALTGADLVITGEGSFDHQSLRGKVISGIAGASRDLGIPCTVLAGRVTTGRREQGAAGVTEAFSLVDHFGSVERAMAEPALGLRELASRLALIWSRSRKAS